jgi:hypothetical protein
MLPDQSASRGNSRKGSDINCIGIHSQSGITFAMGEGKTIEDLQKKEAIVYLCFR